MYSIIRVILFFAVWVLSVHLIRQTRQRHNRKIILWVTIICVLLCSLSCYIPVENYLYTFESAQAVFYYMDFKEIIAALEGDKSCLIVYKSGPSTTECAFVGKDDRGYHILPQGSAQLVSHRADASGIIIVYNIKNTHDYYLHAALGISGEIKVFDADGEIQCSVFSVDNSGIYHIYVSNLSENAYITINTNSINLFD